MSAATESLQALLGHAQSQRDDALSALRQAEASADRIQAQAGQLQQYRGEYRQRWSTQFAQTGSTTLLHCHHGFGQRLNQAIDQQQQQCESAARKVVQARALVQQREQHLAAVRKLIERRLAEQQRAEQRRDQKRTDEAAQRAAWAARATHDTTY